MTLAAELIAMDVAKVLIKSEASHADKFDALVAIIAAIGVPPIET